MKKRKAATRLDAEVNELLGKVDSGIGSLISMLRHSSRTPEIDPAKVKEMERKLFVVRRMLGDLPNLASKVEDERSPKRAKSGMIRRVGKVTQD